ncbi:MAG: tetratricopeptide repeat protein [Polyangiaceae bacterium]
MKRRVHFLVIGAFLAGGMTGCGKSASAPSPSPSSGPTAAATDLPPPLSAYATTSGATAIGNLNGQIKTLEAYLAASEGAPRTGTVVERRRTLVDLLAVRGEFSGKIQDLERSADLAEALPEIAPEASSYLTRAGARASLHRFDAASADLDEAERLGAPKARVRASRVSILEARGQLEEALSLQREATSTRRDIGPAIVLGSLLGEVGRRDEALAAFRKALTEYGDTSPFPVAWLFFQQGTLWEREGRRDLAIAYYRAALERVPTYAHAAAHLARLVPAEQAPSILEPLLATSDDPEILGVLADRLRERGEKEKAETYVTRAAARYDELMTRQPFAFADHAAQFWLDTGGDPKKALDLAKINLQARKTPKAYELAVTAALSAGDRAGACAIGTEGASVARADGMLRDIVKDACAAK